MEIMYKNFNILSMNSTNPLYKVVVLGEGRVGKTSMTLKYIKNQFNDDQESSINACYLEKNLKLINYDSTVKLTIWDTAGQQKYNAVAPVYYRDAMGAIIVYEIVSTQSFEKVKKWVKELRDHSNNKDLIIMIAGNKSDLQNQRRVDKKEAELYAKQNGIKHYEVSAKSGSNISQLFRDLAESIYLKRKNKGNVMMGNSRNPRLRIENTHANKVEDSKKKKKQCCS